MIEVGRSSPDRCPSCHTETGVRDTCPACGLLQNDRDVERWRQVVAELDAIETLIATKSREAQGLRQESNAIRARVRNLYPTRTATEGVPSRSPGTAAATARPLLVEGRMPVRAERAQD